jgi:hypothetical protein
MVSRTTGGGATSPLQASRRVCDRPGMPRPPSAVRVGVDMAALGIDDDAEGCRAAGPVGADVHVVELLSLDPPLALHTVVIRYPEHRRATLVLGCTGPDRQLLTIVEPALALPRGLELRGPGLWLDLQYLVPFDHVTLGVEAFATGLDDPAEALGRAYGDRVPLGLDLEWDTEGPPQEPSGQAGGVPGYELAGRAHGEILIGAERLEIDAIGARRHLFGDTVPWAAPWARELGPAGVRALHPDDAAARCATGDVLAEAPALVTAAAHGVPGVPGFRLDRALVRVQDAGAGEPGTVWIERSTPC